MIKYPEYFNFPIELLKGFIENHKKCLSDILDYCIYEHSLKLNNRNRYEELLTSAEYFRVEIYNWDSLESTGKLIYNRINPKAPKVGLKISIFWDFYKNPDKTEKEKIYLLAFLALKSIIGNKPYCKVTDSFMFARMNGYSCIGLKLNPVIATYNTVYKARAIKHELMTNWGLIHYAKHTRGFYVSFKMNLEKLVLVVERKRKKAVKNKIKQATNEAYKKAMLTLNYTSTIALIGVVIMYYFAYSTHPPI